MPDCKTFLLQVLEKNKYLIAKSPGGLENEAASESPENEVIKQDDKVFFYRVIHSLEDPVKEILLLRLLGDLSFKEIGEILGKNETWARVNFYRGKIKLRERIENHEE